MEMINSIGAGVVQGGSRRSAMYASLNHKHDDIDTFLTVKDWHNMKIPGTDKTFWDAKSADFDFRCPMDMTNISVNYDTEWLTNYWNTGDTGAVFKKNVLQACKTGEPGFSFNFFSKEHETLRNACTEVTSEDDSDVCNLGSINLSRISSLDDLRNVVDLAVAFLLCGTLTAELPYEKIRTVRAKNRRLGLGLMGIHEWLLARGYEYEVNNELRKWLVVYKEESEVASRKYCDDLSISRPVALRAIAPTGTIGILGGTTTGIEPLFSVAYKRRYLKGKRWHYQYVVDSAAQEIIDRYGVDPDSIDTALNMAGDYEKRIKFQARVQKYVDQSISSTINLPSWGTEANNEDTAEKFAGLLADYSHSLRGLTVYPDGSRGGQPITNVPYAECVDRLGEEFEEHVVTHDVCEITGKGGVCGV